MILKSNVAKNVIGKLANWQASMHHVETFQVNKSKAGECPYLEIGRVAHICLHE